MQKIAIDKQVIVFAGLAAVVLIEFTAFPFLLTKVVGFNKSITKLIQDLDYIARDWPQREIYENVKEGKQKEIEAVHTKFLAFRQESKVFSFISASSKEFNMEITSLSPGKIEDYTLEEKSEFKYFPIRMRAKGSSQDLIKFIAFLQDSEYFFEGRELNISYAEPDIIVNITLCALVKQIPQAQPQQ